MAIDKDGLLAQFPDNDQGLIEAINMRNVITDVADNVNPDIADLATHKTGPDHDSRYYTQAQVDSALVDKADAATTITGTNSIVGGGDLSQNRTLALQNDSATPGNNKVYGTDATGTKGWNPDIRLHADLTDTDTDGHPGAAITIQGGTTGNAVTIAADGSLQDGGQPPGGGGGGIPEAPADGTRYGRQDAAWTADPIQSDATGNSLRSAGNWVDAGNSAVLDVGSVAGTVAAGDDSRLGLAASALQNIVEDTTPELGGDLRFGGISEHILITTDASDADMGAIGYVDSALANGTFIAHVLGDDFDINDGAIVVGSGGMEIFGSAARVRSLGHDNELGRVVHVSEDGTLYAIDPVAPGWSATADDSGSYDLGTGTGPGTWVELTFTAAVQADIAAGDPLDIQVKLNATNKTTSRTGVIEVQFGIDGVRDPGAGTQYNIGAGFDGYLPTESFRTTTHGGLTTGQLIGVWARRVSGSHSQFGVDLIGTTDNHHLAISVPSGDGSGGAPTNLGNVPGATSVTITSSTGTGTVIAAAVGGGDAGVITGADQAKLDSLAQFPARTNVTGNSSTWNTELNGSSYNYATDSAFDLTTWSASLPVGGDAATAEYTASIDFQPPSTGSWTMTIPPSWHIMGGFNPLTLASTDKPSTVILRALSDGTIQIYGSSPA